MTPKSDITKRFEKTIDKLSVKYKIPASRIDNIIDQFFEQLKSYLNDPRLPKVIIKNFGVFRPCPGQMRRALSKKFYWYRLGSVTPENMRLFVKRIWPVYRRLMKEKITGSVTWELWKRVDPKNYPDSLEEAKKVENERLEYNRLKREERDAKKAISREVNNSVE